MLNKVKTELSELLFLSRDALHIHIGLGIYVAAMLVLRRGPASIVPWLVEFLDAFHRSPPDIDITGALRDIRNTMLWPTVVLLVARRLARQTEIRTAELQSSSAGAP